MQQFQIRFWGSFLKVKHSISAQPLNTNPQFQHAVRQQLQIKFHLIHEPKRYTCFRLSTCFGMISKVLANNKGKKG